MGVYRCKYIHNDFLRSEACIYVSLLVMCKFKSSLLQRFTGTDEGPVTQYPAASSQRQDAYLGLVVSQVRKLPALLTEGD